MSAPPLRKVRRMTHPTESVASDQAHGHQNSTNYWRELCFGLNASRLRTGRRLARAVVVAARRRVLAFWGPGVATTIWSASGHPQSTR